MAGLHSILLVDDTLSERQVAQHELLRHGVANELVVADSGIMALDYLFGTGAFASAPPAPPLIMLLDLRLPILDGVDVLRRVRADVRTKALPVIVLTGSDTMRESTRCYTSGASHVLVKPLVFTALRSALERLGLDGRLHFTESTPRHP